jgi:superfamily I DNA and/or RNA helicase
VSELDVLVPMASFLPRILIPVGDEKQLRPTVFSRAFKELRCASASLPVDGSVQEAQACLQPSCLSNIAW